MEALKNGYLKARLVEDASGLNISSANTVVVERINRIRSSVLKGLRVISAFKQAAAASGAVAAPAASNNGK